MIKRLSGFVLSILILFSSVLNFAYANNVSINPSREEIEAKIEAVAKKRGIPTVILKSLARVESVFTQFRRDGSVFLGPMGSIGLMQINNRSAGFNTHKLMYDIDYNIEAGAIMLLRKWDEAVKKYGRIPKIGNMDPNVLENWYFALWAYNGWHKSNNPNLVPYKFKNYTKKYAYQDLIYMMALKEYNQPITPIDKKLLKGIGTPSKYTKFETPKPIHKGDIQLYNVADIVEVDVSKRLSYREKPNGKIIGRFEDGTILEILEEAVLVDGYYWHKVVNPKTKEKGWVVRNWITKVGVNNKNNPDGTNSWAKDFIIDLIGKGIIDEDIKKFYPNKYITREELAVYISKAFRFEKTDFEINFTDNDDIDKKYFEYIKTVVEAGYLSGYPDNKFKPKKYLTREEMATILSKIVGISENLEVINYNDLEDISSWSRDFVMNVSKLGIMNGKGNNYFKPKDYLTKAEASKVISDMLKVLN